ncbi:hypothetical protein AB0E54_35960, partial [Amycolatopsis coloradensis]|uniref:hypothetical protein n=1 Tax=Amycolatopsis coloradensis TaxID=76021 RepID=UPI0033EA84ED
AGLVRVDRQDDEGDQQRQVTDDAGAVDAHGPPKATFATSDVPKVAFATHDGRSDASGINESPP